MIAAVIYRDWCCDWFGHTVSATSIAAATAAVSAALIVTESATVAICTTLAVVGIATVPSDLTMAVIAAVVGAASNAAH